LGNNSAGKPAIIPGDPTQSAILDHVRSPDPDEVAPRCDDLTFIRRVFLDAVGVPPSVAEARAFLADEHRDKRERLIDRLLDDPRWADVWTASWQLARRKPEPRQWHAQQHRPFPILAARIVPRSQADGRRSDGACKVGDPGRRS
jgi:hypothetical protein